jgi:DNA (cytosine-5)-methyltransferase 1
LWRTPDTGGGETETIIRRQESSSEWSFNSDKVTRSSEQSKAMANTSTKNVQRQRKSIGIREERDSPSGTGWWAIEPRMGRVAHGVASRVDRLKAIGNGQVPLVAATAWRILNEL